MTIDTLPQLFELPAAGRAQPVQTRTPSSGRFFRALGRTRGDVAPVAGVNARLFTDMGTTSRRSRAIPTALAGHDRQVAATLDVDAASLRVQRPFLDDTADFSHDLRCATTRAARRAARHQPGARGRHAGAQALGADSTSALKGALAAARDLIQRARRPTRRCAGSTATVTTLNPPLRTSAPT